MRSCNELGSDLYSNIFHLPVMAWWPEMVGNLRGDVVRSESVKGLNVVVSLFQVRCAVMMET